MAVNVIVGLQRGDEGKGRFVDILAQKHDIVARFNGGNNAGHTVVLPDRQVLKLHLVPSGITRPDVVNIIGNGTLLNPAKLIEEIADIESKGVAVSPGNLMISSGAHLILPQHISMDEIREASANRQGSTKSGIAQAASDKSLRIGARAEMINNDPSQLFHLAYNGLIAQRELRSRAGLPHIDEETIAMRYIDCAKRLGAFVADTVIYLNNALDAVPPARVLAEGAQAFLLDIDHGMYPYTTSSSTTAGGVAIGLGVPPSAINRVIGVAKAVQSHVGDGPFVTEITDADMLQQLHGDMTTVDAERGTTTGRTRRLGHFDLPAIRRANIVNGTDDIVITKLDWVPRFGDRVNVCVAYKQDETVLQVAPDSARELEQCHPIYDVLPTWDDDIKEVRRFLQLPLEARNYIHYLEASLGVPISMIGVGPNREQVISRSVRAGKHVR